MYQQQMKQQNSFLHKNFYEGHKGRIMLELSKTYKGDSRFKLNDKFKDDIEIEKLPEKFKVIVEQQIIDKCTQKHKKIKKSNKQPLIIPRFEPGTQKASKILKKAEQKRKQIQKIRQKTLQSFKKRQMVICKGIDKVKKADFILKKAKQLGQYSKNSMIKPKFSIEVKGDRMEAFRPSNFKLFE